MLAGPVALGAARLASLHIGNTALTVLDAQAPYGVHELNSTRHLDASVQDDPHGLVGG